MALTDWQEGLGLGFGYDQVRGDAKARAVVGESAPPANAAGQIGEFNLVLIQSEKEFDESLDIDVDVGAGLGLFGGSAKFGFKKRCKVSSQATFCALRAVATNAFEQMSDPELSRDARELLENRNMKRFRERFGDKFVNGQVTGIEFYGVVRIEAQKIERQMEIASKVQASYGFFNAGGSVNFNEKMSSSEHRIEISTYQKGGAIQTCSSIAELFALAKAALDAGRSGKGYPFAVMLDPYTEIKLPGDDASFIETEAAQRTIQKLAEHMWALQKLQNDVDFVLRNQAWFESPNVEALNRVNKLITSELNTVVERADICSKDFSKCKAYSPTYPEFTMPLRRVGAPEPPPPPPPVVTPQSGNDRLRAKITQEYTNYGALLGKR